MVILRDALICLSLFISFILAITDYTDPANQTPALQVLWKETQKRCVTMEINKVYSFRQKDVDKITSHTRLVVGHIFKDDEDDDGELWDFQAWWFDLVFIQKRPFDSIWGGKCIDRNGEWECRDGNVFKFKGEVDIQMFQEIDTVVGAQAQALIAKNDCYNLVTNNCQTFARNLAKKINKKPPKSPPPQPPLDQPFDMQPRFSID